MCVETMGRAQGGSGGAYENGRGEEVRLFFFIICIALVVVDGGSAAAGLLVHPAWIDTGSVVLGAVVPSIVYFEVEQEFLSWLAALAVQCWSDVPIAVS